MLEGRNPLEMSIEELISAVEDQDIDVGFDSPYSQGRDQAAIHGETVPEDASGGYRTDGPVVVDNIAQRPGVYAAKKTGIDRID